MNGIDLILKQVTKKGKTYDFQKFKIITSFWREVFSGILTLNDGVEEQINLKYEADKFKDPTKPNNLPPNKKRMRKKKKNNTNFSKLLKGRKKALNGFESKTLPLGKHTQGEAIKILTPKQILQRLPIPLAQSNQVIHQKIY